MIIYKITNKINGLVYIGQTVQTLKERWRDHCSPSSKKYSYLTRSILKNGEEAFTKEIIGLYNDIDDLNNAEEFYIEYYNSLSPNGYNLTTGGGNRRLSEETKNKISASNTGKKMSSEACENIGFSKRGEKNPWFGKHLPLEMTNKISVANKGKIRTEKTKQNISKSKIGKTSPMKGIPRKPETVEKIANSLKGKTTWMKGKTHTEEAKRKNSEAHKGKKASKEAKKKMSVARMGNTPGNITPIICLNNNVIYKSQKDAAQALNISQGNLNNVLKGRIKHTKGYHFKYIKKETE